MDVLKLLANVEIVKVENYKKTDAVGVESDSRKSVDGKLFFCLKGSAFDGTVFAAEAEGNGAAAIVSEREVSVSIPLFLVKNARKAFAIACGNLYDNPAGKMNVVTVVGTNGKTSTTEILSSIFSYAGFKTATVGTLGYKIDGERKEGVLTTPDPIDLHYNLSRMFKQGVEYVFMEASAHAIHYDKLAGIRAKAGILTNITQDHLDFFGNMKRYADVKLSYFCHPNTALAVVNSDDPYAVRLLEDPKVPTISYGIDNPADVFAIDVEDGEKGLSFTINAFDCIFDIVCPLCGIFNVYNIMAATATAMYMGIGAETIKKALANMEKIPGRYDVRYLRERRVVIDYAHTPDGLSNLLRAVRSRADGSVFTVFGCGGNRDKTKRPLMGKIASEYSDFTIVTNDNPRFEKEETIASEIASGIPSGSKFEIVLDRAAAIHRAFELSKSGDVIVIAGKGHETYMDIQGEKIPYSDEEILRELEE